MLNATDKSLWELLWDYDPNGLVAIDREMKIRVVNPAFCRMFQVDAGLVIGQPARKVLPDAAELMDIWRNGETEMARETEYPKLGLYVRQVIFSIESEGILGCIMVDLTREWEQKKALARMKRETVEKVNEVVNTQMRVAQEIASLLGETTAESKASLLRLMEVLDQEYGIASR